MADNKGSPWPSRKSAYQSLRPVASLFSAAPPGRPAPPFREGRFPRRLAPGVTDRPRRSQALGFGASERRPRPPRLAVWPSLRPQARSLFDLLGPASPRSRGFRRRRHSHYGPQLEKKPAPQGSLRPIPPGPVATTAAISIGDSLPKSARPRGRAERVATDLTTCSPSPSPNCFSATPRRLAPPTAPTAPTTKNHPYWPSAETPLAALPPWRTANICRPLQTQRRTGN